MYGLTIKTDVYFPIDLVVELSRTIITWIDTTHSMWIIWTHSM